MSAPVTTAPTKTYDQPIRVTRQQLDRLHHYLVAAIGHTAMPEMPDEEAQDIRGWLAEACRVLAEIENGGPLS